MALIPQRLVDKYYSHMDYSHGINHIEKVRKLAHSLLDDLNDKDTYIMDASASFHDAYDHKYCTESQVKEIQDRIKIDLKEIGFTDKDIDNIFIIIENISFSKEKKRRDSGIEMNLGDLQSIRDAVSDADKLESIGDDALKRMIHFEKNVVVSDNPDELKQHVDHIIEHCEEKLFILVEENYIRLPKAREMATKYIEKLRQIVNDKEKLKEIILQELQTI